VAVNTLNLEFRSYIENLEITQVRRIMLHSFRPKEESEMKLKNRLRVLHAEMKISQKQQKLGFSLIPTCDKWGIPE